MSYPYSKRNCLDEKINYMYASFEGVSLLKKYKDNRLFILETITDTGKPLKKPANGVVLQAIKVLGKQFDRMSAGAGSRFNRLIGPFLPEPLDVSEVPGYSMDESPKPLEPFTDQKEIETRLLLEALTGTLLVSEEKERVKMWLDRIVHRFEVTGKIFEVYPPGFRKGKGSHKTTELYWMSALSLCLYYARFQEIKYVSTLLKIGDVLCSLPAKTLREEIPGSGLHVLLAAEVVFIQQLAETRGVSDAII